MRATTTLGNLIDQVETISCGNFDENISLDKMEFASLNEVWIENVSVDVLAHAQSLLCNRLRVPFTYLKRCSPQLQAANLNHWLVKERKKRDSFFCRFNGQKQLRAVFTDRYTAIDNTEILYKMLNSGFRHDQQVQYLLDDSMMIVRVPEFGRSFEVSFKDEVVPGLSFGNSEIGCLSFCIECFYLRLVCTNGLTVATTIGQSRFKHISRKAFDELPETIRQVAQGSDRQRNQMVLAVQRPVDDPIQTIEAYNKQFGLTNEEAEMVRVSWQHEPTQNMWGVIQAYTASAKVPWLDVEAAYKLERIGGHILAAVK